MSYTLYSPADLAEHVNTLVVALAQWEDRDDTKAQPEVRRAASTAMDEIDTLLRKLYRVRGQLVGQIRKSDDASAARVDELLTRRTGVQ